LLDISAVFERICEIRGLKTDAALADFLGVSPSSINQSRKRQTADLWNILDKCRDMDFNWLLKGQTAAAPLTMDAALSAMINAGYEVSIRKRGDH
jgi:hypothetical protein